MGVFSKYKKSHAYKKYLSLGAFSEYKRFASYCTLYGQYACKAVAWSNRYVGYNGGKITSQNTSPRAVVLSYK